MRGCVKSIWSCYDYKISLNDQRRDEVAGYSLVWTLSSLAGVGGALSEEAECSAEGGLQLRRYGSNMAAVHGHSSGLTRDSPHCCSCIIHLQHDSLGEQWSVVSDWNILWEMWNVGDDFDQPAISLPQTLKTKVFQQSYFGRKKYCSCESLLQSYFMLVLFRCC